MSSLVQPDLIPAQTMIETQWHRGRDQHLLSTGHPDIVTQGATAARESFCPPAIDDAKPKRTPLAGTDLIPVQVLSEPHGMPGRDQHLLSSSHVRCATHPGPAGRESFCPPSIECAKPMHAALAGNISGWVELRICVDLFERAQAARIAAAAMIRSAVVDQSIFAPHLDQLTITEHQARLALRRCYRRVVPAEIRAWQKASPGIGEDSLARILGHLGDPYIATPHHWEGTGTARKLVADPARVRSISELWQYAGHGAPGRMTKGMTATALAALGSPKIKMAVHLQAEWCMKKPKSVYRDLYLAIRRSVESRTHATECVRCGPSGRPAAIGSPWSPGHQHAHALRIVGKEILRDMWLARHRAESGAA